MTPQPMSRRQRREAERAAEAARQLAEAEAGGSSPETPTTHTTHAASPTRRSRREIHARHSHQSQGGAVRTTSALPDVPLAPQKQNHPQRPAAHATPPAAAPATRSGAHAAPASAHSAPIEQTGRQPVVPMSRMARRHQGAVEQPEQPVREPMRPHPAVSAPTAPSAPAVAPAAGTAQPSPAGPSVSSASSPQAPGQAHPTRRSRKDLRAAQIAEDPQQTRENPAVANVPQSQPHHQSEARPESRRSRRRSHAAEQSAVSPASSTPSAPSALSPLVAASLAESTSNLKPAAAQPAANTAWWAAGDTAPASSGAAQARSRAVPTGSDSAAVPGASARPESRRRRRASAATPASASAKPVVASTTHHTASFSVPEDSVSLPTPQAAPEVTVEPAPAAPSVPDTPHEIRFSRRITDFRGAETVEVPEVRKLMAARKAGVPLADEAAIRAAKTAQGARTSRETKKTASDESASSASSARISAASKPDSHRDSSTGPAPARPARRRTGTGILGRTAVLSALAVATVLAPLSSHLDNTPLASAAMKMHAGGAAQSPAAGGAKSSSVASAVLGRDDDLEESSDSQLSNVPDAATRARIREAFQNAAKTCSSATGASGDTSAFSSKPQLFYPMLPDTYTISSEYGYRTHPTLGVPKLHAGQDMAAPVGTPIYAAAAGTVTTAGMVDGTGTVTIKHEIDGQVWYTSYLHMYEDGIYVKAGDTVTAGQMIAGVGNTGRSSGAHLHFEVRTKDDTADESTVEPWGWLKEHGAVELTTNCS
ncbi:M23 family metallopeptidase [Actinomyces johnsonii]|uniref:M23 family metallopeptidase n=1 Tax=Actinomyces johnsonii TaxID=544581 RepID=UPI0003FFE7DE|nr:M23 family metallopeptidase [Actinomyces johnsonii]